MAAINLLMYLRDHNSFQVLCHLSKPVLPCLVSSLKATTVHILKRWEKEVKTHNLQFKLTQTADCFLEFRRFWIKESAIRQLIILLFGQLMILGAIGDIDSENSLLPFHSDKHVLVFRHCHFSYMIEVLISRNIYFIKIIEAEPAPGRN